MIDIDLFAGGGGLAVGLERAGFDPLRLYEHDRFACRTLSHNADNSKVLKSSVFEADVTGIDWSKRRDTVRLLAAGAPCQPFSLGGRHLAQNDGRNLFPEVLRAIRFLRPKVVLLENVRGLLRENFEPYFQYILRQLEFPDLGPRANELWETHNRRLRVHRSSSAYRPLYRVGWRNVEAADHGVPQMRQRVFIVATRVELPQFHFPVPTHSREALVSAQASADYWERRSVRRPLTRTMGAIETAAANRLPWVTVRDALANLPGPADQEEGAWMNHWRIRGARAYTGHTGSTLDSPAKTVKAGVHGVPGGENTLVEDDGSFRYFTLRELARIQTFPDTYLFLGARIHVTRQIGNAVPCVLAEAMGRSLMNVLAVKSPILNSK